MRVYRGKQAQVASLWERSADFVICHGPYRSGKTTAALDGFLMYALLRGGTYLLAAPSVKQIRQVLVAQILLNHPSATLRQSGAGWMQVGRNTIFLAHPAGDESAEGRIRGIGLEGAFIDEATLVPESFWQQVISRCSEGQTPGKVVACTNPDAPTHWLKEKFIDFANGDAIESHPFSIDDNPALSERFKERQRRTLTGVWLARGYYGEWVSAAGAIYPTAPSSAGEPPAHQQPRAVWLCGDYGNTDPTHFLRVEEYEDGVRYVTREWRWAHADGGHLTDAEKADAILTRLGQGELTAIHVDPSALAMIEELRRRTYAPVLGGVNDLLPGIQQTASMFELGLLKVSPHGCPSLWGELSRYSWDPRAMARGHTRPLHDSSHGPDALRYHVASTLRETGYDDW